MLTAVRSAAAALLECGGELDAALSGALSEMCAPGRQGGEFEQLEALQFLQSVLSGLPFPAPETPLRAVRDLVDVVWMSVFQRYFALRARQKPRDA